MGENLSSESASVGKGQDGQKPISSPENYETLEEFIYATERDKDREGTVPVRIFNWEDTLMSIIEVEENTNRTEIIARAYPMGLADLRESKRSKIKEIEELANSFMKVYVNDEGNKEAIERIDADRIDKEIDQPYGEDDELTDSIPFRVRSSFLSEAKSDYVDRSYMGGWVHRHIIGLGLWSSKHLGKYHDNKLSSYAAAFSKAIDEYRYTTEKMILEYIVLSRPNWRKTGLSKDIYEGLCDLVGMLNTEHKDDIEAELAEVEKYVEGDNDD